MTESSNISAPCKLLIVTGLVAGFIFVASPLVRAANLPIENSISAALQDLSAATGQTITTKEQAAEICDQEKYFVTCAQIGKKYQLYKKDEVKDVDAFLNEIKGQIAEELAQCQDPECLVSVAQEFANKLAQKDPRLASKFDLTKQMVQKKKAIFQAAKELGVSFESCQQMDPDTAPVDLLRACAKLAKDSRVVKEVPEGDQGEIDKTQDVAALREALASGQIQCGDNTLEGCSRFCMNPGPQASGQGTAAIPAVCREIAQKFFGPDGIKRLEETWRQVNNPGEGEMQNFDEQGANEQDNETETPLPGPTHFDQERFGHLCAEHGGTWNGATCLWPSYTPYPSYSSYPSYSPYPTYSYSPYPSVDPAIGCVQHGGSWNGSTCIFPSTSAGPQPSYSQTPTPEPSASASPSPSPNPATECASHGGAWNGATCVFPTISPTPTPSPSPTGFGEPFSIFAELLKALGF